MTEGSDSGRESSQPGRRCYPLSRWLRNEMPKLLEADRAGLGSLLALDDAHPHGLSLLQRT